MDRWFMRAQGPGGHGLFARSLLVDARLQTRWAWWALAYGRLLERHERHKDTLMSEEPTSVAGCVGLV